MGDFFYHGRFFLPWEIFPKMEDFSYQGRFFLRWEIFSIHGRFSPSWKIFFYIPWEISLAKRNHVGQAQRKIVHYGRFYSPGEILFAMGDKIYPWMFNLGRYISLFHNHVVSLWLDLEVEYARK